MKLCPPANVYLILSIAFLFITSLSIMNGVNVYCMGSSCKIPHLGIFLIIKLIFIAFWTWVLNLICRAGAPSFAWFLVLFPYILLAFIVSAMIFGLIV